MGEPGSPGRPPAGPHVQALLSKLDGLVAEPPEIVTYTVLPGGLPEKSRLG